MFCKFRTSEFRELKVSIFLTSLLVNPWTTGARWKNVPYFHEGRCLETFYNISNLFGWTGKNPMILMFALFLKHKATLLTSKSVWNYKAIQSLLLWQDCELKVPEAPQPCWRCYHEWCIEWFSLPAVVLPENALKPLCLHKCFRKVLIYE